MKLSDLVKSSMGRVAAAAVLVGLFGLLPAGAKAGKPARATEGFTSSFRLGECDFKSRGHNPNFILKPGRRLVLEDEDAVLWITVLHKTKKITLLIDGKWRKVETRIVEERETEDGELVEISRNFYAMDANTRDVYYFGEEVDDYADGEIVGHSGAWLAGEGEARPGIIMPGSFLLGSRYYQEVAPGVALDRGEHTDMGFSMDTPYGTLEDCVEVIETTELEPGSESRKVYCPGIGLVADGTLLLTEVIENIAVENEDD